MQEPDEAWDNGEVGLWLSHWLPGWDVGLGYYYGWDKTPQMLDGNGLGYQRQHMIGANAAGSLGSGVIRKETALFLPEKTTWHAAWALGYEFYPWNDSHLLLQLAGSVSSDEFDQRVGMNLSHTLAPHVEIGSQAIISLSDKGWVLGPALTWDAADGLQITAGGFAITVEEGSTLDTLKDQDHWYLKVKYSF